MSSFTSNSSNQTTSTSASTYRVNYSDYVANITKSPTTPRKLPTSGIGHHIHVSAASSSTRPGSKPTGTMPFYGGGSEKCARCSQNVYLAEKKIGAGRPYHNTCFNCKNCRRKLDSSTLSEHKGEIYCKSCYTKNFGAHGLISGVNMSTERYAHESRPTRRSSFGSDLDTPVVNYQPTRYRAHSTENLLADDRQSTGRTSNAVDIPIVIESRRNRSRSPSPIRQPDCFIPVITYVPRPQPRLIATDLDAPSSAVTDFITKTNQAANPPSPTSNTKFSTLGALAKPRSGSQSGDDDFD